ncbi:MAG: hypothetical protein Q8934_23635 [Bacillota bacterium]|nr:hypothetical protein [Bacillota bacterium]
MSKNIIEPNELFELLKGWKGSYCLKQNHGTITLVEMKNSYKCNDFKTFQELLDLLSKNYKYYKFLSLTYDSNQFRVILTAAVRKENIMDFLRFKNILLQSQQVLEEIGVINS